MQTASQKEFKERMRRAIEVYGKAQEFYERLTHNQKAARMLRCRAAVKYLGFWLTFDPSEKRKLLDECLELKKNALAAFWTLGKMSEYCRTYSELSLAFFHRLSLELDGQVRKGIVEEGIQWGEKAVAVLPELGDPYESARAHFVLATCLGAQTVGGFFGGLLVPDIEKQELHRLKVVEYLCKALEFSEKVGDALLLGLSHFWLGTETTPHAVGEESVRHFEKTLECGKETRDNFLIAGALDFLAYTTYWKAIATEEPNQRRKLAEEAIQLYEKCQHYYSLISSLSPRGGLIAPPGGYVEHYLYLAMWETNPKKRLEFLENSEKAGMEALKVAENSDMPAVVATVLHMVSKTLETQAHLEPDPAKRRSHLQKALKYREKTIEIYEQLTPFDYWNRGVMENYLAGIKAELADIEPFNGKRRLLEEAAVSKEKCLKLCGKVTSYSERMGNIMLFALLHRYQDTYTTLLMQLYDVAKKTRTP